MQDHVLIINSPNNNAAVYFERLVSQLRSTAELHDTPARAKAIIVLARDEYSRVSDSITLDVLSQLQELCQAGLPYTVAECVHEDSRRRTEMAGASTTPRPIRAYPEMLVRSLVAPGAEKILENLFTHHDDHAMRYPVHLEDAVWSDVTCRLMTAGMGTLMAYVAEDGHITCHPAHDHRFNARP
ncbi:MULTISPECIES: hypothetical protein [Halomonadaceae]|uniref:hypothetical protein n=1 Tax=Halomonadaceae TaxID=28256 RepID=UPI0019174C15|nr:MULTISPECIES: hypothetical protein [Halomonas]MCD6009131.1 hypothetical protein [Halomonas sp. IOP_31]